MTQTNTTQNKEELNINDLLDTFESDVICELGIEPDGDNLSVKTTDEVVEALQPVVEELLIQAHQSGIEEERKRIVKIIESFIDPNPVFLEEHREKIFLKEVIKSLKENK